jgi:hypothetical protein
MIKKFEIMLGVVFIVSVVVVFATIVVSGFMLYIDVSRDFQTQIEEQTK